MAANEILPFAQDGAALVLTQAAYAADAERLIGNQPSVARPDFCNKVWRQSSVLSAGLAQFLADNQGTDITDLLTSAALSTIILNAIKSVTLMPAGSIIWVPGLNAPAGTIKLNGALLNRVTYARLWAFAQIAGNITSDGSWPSFPGIFSTGDGSTNFRIPDMRGYSVRAWDDGRGIDVGRAVGSTQNDQQLIHNHAVSDPTHTHSMSNPAHSHSVSDPGHAHGVSDPGHAHSVNDPGHWHVIQHATNSATAGGGLSGADHTDNSNSTNTALTNISINGAGTNVSVQSNTSNISVVANNTAVSAAANGTGISVQNSSGGTEVRVKSIAMMPVMFY